jgi:hypothetical protein
VYDKKVLEVQGGKQIEGTQIFAHGASNKRHQKWYILYKDNVKADNRTMVDGFRVNEPFYIFSKMPMNRVIGGTSYVYMQTLTKAKTQ